VLVIYLYIYSQKEGAISALCENQAKKLEAIAKIAAYASRLKAGQQSPWV
jgi:hypothetical protein